MQQLPRRKDAAFFTKRWLILWNPFNGVWLFLWWFSDGSVWRDKEGWHFIPSGSGVEASEGASDGATAESGSVFVLGDVVDDVGGESVHGPGDLLGEGVR